MWVLAPFWHRPGSAPFPPSSFWHRSEPEPFRTVPRNGAGTVLAPARFRTVPRTGAGTVLAPARFRTVPRNGAGTIWNREPFQHSSTEPFRTVPALGTVRN